MYGKIISNLTIHGTPATYPVVNEREVRGAAGIMFAIALVAFMYVFLTKDFRPMYVIVPIFWIDFFLKSVFQATWSIFGFLAKFFVMNQDAEYVGAVQKRFAWSLGLVLATAMMVGPVFMHIRGVLPLAICSVCLFFMWLESTFGICVGCKIYTWLLQKKVLKEPDVRPACAGGVCRVELSEEVKTHFETRTKE